MAPDEVIVLGISVLAAFLGWGRRYARALGVRTLGNPHLRRLPLYLMPPACLGLLCAVLTRWADPEVRGNGGYIALFLAVGAGGQSRLGARRGMQALPAGVARFVGRIADVEGPLPETRDPRRADWRRAPGWLLRAAFCNAADAVTIRALARPRLWRRVAAFFRFRRNPLGGFGGFIPEAAVG